MKGNKFAVNALTVDLEDWYHGCCQQPAPVVPREKRRLRRNTELILDLLAKHGVKATFFTLGSVAEEDTALIPMIAAAGHEVSSHGFSHTLVPALGPAEFRAELRRTSDIIAGQCGRRPTGFRAPQWSLGPAAPWAIDILRQEGFVYDSSYNPLAFVGNRRGPRSPFHLDGAGGRLLELPPMVSASPIGNLPTGGGWGFRFFPMQLIRRTIDSLNSKGLPAILYLHPRELDPLGPRLPLSRFQSFISYGLRTDAGPRLAEVLTSFSFTTLRELAATWQSA